jgi:cytochrome c553
MSLALAWTACSDGEAAAPAADAGRDVAQPPEDASVDAEGSPDSSAPWTCATDDDPDGSKRHLECTGLYADAASKVVAPDVRAYRPALEFWSDGAAKQRWIHLPPGTTIDASDVDEWVFPAGTKLWKEFSLEGRRVETRLYEKTAAGWRHAVYRWNAAETSAERLETGEKLPPTGARSTTYEIPDATQCKTCHDGRKEPVLGFDAVGLGLPGAEGVTLGSLAKEGRLNAAPATTDLVVPDDLGDGTGPSALGFLHANCGGCHNDNAAAVASYTKPKLLLHASELLGEDGGAAPTSYKGLRAYATTVCKAANRTDPDGGAPYALVQPGAPTASLVAILAGQRVAEGKEPSSGVQMPPIVTRAVDGAGHAKLTSWISALAAIQPTCP